MDKMIFIGKNYGDHALEMQKIAGDAPAEKPVLFIKPPSVLRSEPDHLELPIGRGDVHHETEIVLRIGKLPGDYTNGFFSRALTREEADNAIDAVTLGLDMTLRDLQTGIKKSGGPWEVAKTFNGSAVVGPWISKSDFPNFVEHEFTLAVNGRIRQASKGIYMKLSPTECVRYASEYFTLCPGDLIFTGTPSGVAAIASGDEAQLVWKDRLQYSVRWK